MHKCLTESPHFFSQILQKIDDHGDEVEYQTRNKNIEKCTLVTLSATLAAQSSTF